MRGHSTAARTVNAPRKTWGRAAPCAGCASGAPNVFAMLVIQPTELLRTISRSRSTTSTNASLSSAALLPAAPLSSALLASSAAAGALSAASRRGAPLS